MAASTLAKMRLIQRSLNDTMQSVISRTRSHVFYFTHVFALICIKGDSLGDLIKTNTVIKLQKRLEEKQYKVVNFFCI